MRRSSVVRLTLLPMLATAAAAGLAAADPPPTAAPSEPPTAAPSVPPDYTTPSESPPLLAPPGMTPTIVELDCENDPNWRLRPDCVDDDVYWYDSGGVIRGGFGTYFYGGGGG